MRVRIVAWQDLDNLLASLSKNERKEITIESDVVKEKKTSTHLTVVTSMARIGGPEWGVSGLIEIPNRSSVSEGTSWRPFHALLSLPAQQGEIEID